ncbi:MAG: hypothetical protein LBH29_07645, partial [Elusimicrobiota bacterium]|nr:hypothetical protein [Elusimicrobiota bacterium]
MQKLKYFISFFKTSKFFKTCKTLFDMPLNFLGSDMLGVCNDKWKAIPNLYKKTFLIVFLSLNVSWALDMAGFFQITNHDWREGLLYRQSFIPWQVVSGRYFFTFINALLLKGEYLPILSHLTAFAGFSLAAICLCIYWKVPQTLFFYSLICLLAVFQPHFLYLIGYRISFVSFSVTFFFIPLAFIISERYFQKEAARSFCRTVLYIAIPDRKSTRLN